MIRRIDQIAVNDYFTLSTITYFDWFPLHTRMETSFRVILTHGVYQNSLLFSTFLSYYAQRSQSAILITLGITIRDEHDEFFD